MKTENAQKITDLITIQRYGANQFSPQFLGDKSAEFFAALSQVVGEEITDQNVFDKRDLINEKLPQKSQEEIQPLVKVMSSFNKIDYYGAFPLDMKKVQALVDESLIPEPEELEVEQAAEAPSAPTQDQTPTVATHEYVSIASALNVGSGIGVDSFTEIKIGRDFNPQAVEAPVRKVSAPATSLAFQFDEVRKLKVNYPIPVAPEAAAPQVTKTEPAPKPAVVASVQSPMPEAGQLPVPEAPKASVQVVQVEEKPKKSGSVEPPLPSWEPGVNNPLLASATPVNLSAPVAAEKVLAAVDDTEEKLPPINTDLTDFAGADLEENQVEVETHQEPAPKTEAPKEEVKPAEAAVQTDVLKQLFGTRPPEQVAQNNVAPLEPPVPAATPAPSPVPAPAAEKNPASVEKLDLTKVDLSVLKDRRINDKALLEQLTGEKLADGKEYSVGSKDVKLLQQALKTGDADKLAQAANVAAANAQIFDVNVATIRNAARNLNNSNWKDDAESVTTIVTALKDSGIALPKTEELLAKKDVSFAKSRLENVVISVAEKLEKGEGLSPREVNALDNSVHSAVKYGAKSKE